MYYHVISQIQTQWLEKKETVLGLDFIKYFGQQ